MSDITWASVDPSKRCTGFAIWSGARLTRWGTITPANKTQQKNFAKARQLLRVTHVIETVLYFGTGATEAVVETLPAEPACGLREAFGKAFVNDLHGKNLTLIMENPMGAMPRSVAEIAWYRGYITSLVDERLGTVIDVNTSEWRRVAAEAWGISWPRQTDLIKELAVKLVKENYGLQQCDIGPDEAEAILIGHWGLRTRTVP